MRVIAVVLLTLVGGLVAANAEEAKPPPRLTLEWLALNDPDHVVCAHYYHEGIVIPRAYCKSARYWFMEHERLRREILEWQVRRLQTRR